MEIWKGIIMLSKIIKTYEQKFFEFSLMKPVGSKGDIIQLPTTIIINDLPGKIINFSLYYTVKFQIAFFLVDLFFHNHAPFIFKFIFAIFFPLGVTINSIILFRNKYASKIFEKYYLKYNSEIDIWISNAQEYKFKIVLVVLGWVVIGIINGIVNYTI
jgi:hypothetical protein